MATREATPPPRPAAPATPQPRRSAIARAAAKLRRSEPHPSAPPRVDVELPAPAARIPAIAPVSVRPAPVASAQRQAASGSQQTSAARPTGPGVSRQPTSGSSAPRQSTANGRTLARRPRQGAQPAAKPVSAPPAPTADLAAAAAAAGAEIQTGGDFLEISFPPPAGIPQPSTASAPTGPAIARMPTAAEAAGIYRDSAAAPRQLGGGSTLARATYGGSGSSGGGSSGDAVVSAVLRAMREENEHLGILDGIDPLY
jgi:hypothetical protein